MVKKVKQFRYYGKNNTANTITYNELLQDDLPRSSDTAGSLSTYMPIIYLGIQTIPGVKVSLNGFMESPIIIGASGIYELDLEGTTGLINSVLVQQASLDMIDRNPEAYILIDIIYKDKED